MSAAINPPNGYRPANRFLHSSAMGLMISYVGVLVFTGLTAYDVQKIKAMNVTGALRLYLDFINLFIMLLRITGTRR